MKSVGVIMAGGKGKRFGAQGYNKTAGLFAGKPIVKYGVELFDKTTDKIVVVVGVEPESVKQAIGENVKVTYATQPVPNGTGGAFQAAMDKIIAQGWEPETVFVGNGDHMMFYQPETLRQMQETMQKTGAAAVLVSIMYPEEPDKFVWGRVVKDKNGFVERIVEQKDASPEERKIPELNVNFYGFDFKFAKEHYKEIEPSAVTGEFYITEMVGMAKKYGQKAVAVVLPFTEVGIGINTPEELRESEALYKQYAKVSD